MTELAAHRTGNRMAFSLIEMLSVIVILAVLLLATLPAFRAARSSAQRNTAASEAMEIAGAALEFRRVYGCWPCEEEAPDAGTTLTAGKREDGRGLDAYDLDIGKVVHVLLGDDGAPYRRHNPRAIPFLELPRGCFRQKDGDERAYPYDPWGRPYVLLMSRAVQRRGKSASDVNRIEGGITFNLAALGESYLVDTPDDAAAFSWGDPTLAVGDGTNGPPRIVGSWSLR
jgi:hypothetical protein